MIIDGLTLRQTRYVLSTVRVDFIMFCITPPHDIKVPMHISLSPKYVTEWVHTIEYIAKVEGFSTLDTQAQVKALLRLGYVIEYPPFMFHT